MFSSRKAELMLLLVSCAYCMVPSMKGAECIQTGIPMSNLSNSINLPLPLSLDPLLALTPAHNP